MNTAVKAALWSGLVFPGCGHLLLKRYARGIGIIVIALLSLYIVVADALQKAKLITDKIVSGEIPLDVTAITAQADAAMHSADSITASVATWVMLLCWVFAIIDSYRLGKGK